MEKVLFDNANIQRKLQSQEPPKLNHGYCLLFESSVPIDMKYVDYDRNVRHLGSQEVVNFKIFTSGYKPNIGRLKVEIDSDGDPFFSSSFETDQSMYSILRDEQKLNFEFQELPTVIIKSLNRIEEESGKVSASLLIYSDGKCKLTLWQGSEYKNIEVIALEFNQETEEVVEAKVASRYQRLRKQIQQTEERLAKINQIVRERNPSLLMQLTKGHPSS